MNILYRSEAEAIVLIFGKCICRDCLNCSSNCAFFDNENFLRPRIFRTSITIPSFVCNQIPLFYQGPFANISLQLYNHDIVDRACSYTNVQRQRSNQPDSIPGIAGMSFDRVVDDEPKNGTILDSAEGTRDGQTEDPTMQPQLGECSNDQAQKLLLRIHADQASNDHERRRAFQSRLNQLDTAFVHEHASQGPSSWNTLDTDISGLELKSESDIMSERGKLPERKEKENIASHGNSCTISWRDVSTHF
jgi:hypothetical protein